DGVTVDDPDDDSDGTGDLWAAVTQSVVTDGASFACDATAFGGTLTPFAEGALGTADAGSTTQTLAAESGSTQYYCVRLTLPDTAPDSLQGRTIAPAWEFASVSD